MSTIVLRSVKGGRLTSTEVDTNFSNLNTDKIEKKVAPLVITTNTDITAYAYHKVISAVVLTLPSYSEGVNFGLINMSHGNLTLTPSGGDLIMGVNDSITIDIKNIPLWFRRSDNTHGWILE